MFKNQYFATSSKIENSFENMNRFQFNGLSFFLHPSLSSSKVINGNNNLLLIGYIIDPNNPDYDNDKILNSISSNSNSKESFLKLIQYYSGRYVIFYKDDDSFIVVSDAVHFRQIYYSFDNGTVTLTSSMKMYLDFFNTDIITSNEKKEFIEHPEFTRREFAWFGDKTIDDRIFKLLPNHYLDISRKNKSRLSYYTFSHLKKEEDYLEYTAGILKGTYDYLHRHFTLIQPLTCGLDSRALLAASKKYKDEIDYYLFDKEKYSNVADIRIPRKLSKKLDFRFNVYQRDSFSDEFLLKFKREHILPRIIPKTANIQHHYYNANEKTVSISGVVGEVVRCFYGYTQNKNVRVDLLYEFSGYRDQVKFVRDEIEDWLSGAIEYANDNELSLLDLFYWEQRLGNWGSLYPYEQDIAIEENSPFNNRSLLMNLHRISYKKRRAPQYSFFVELIKMMWPEVLSEPINPDRSTFIDMIKERARLRYYILMSRRKFQKIN